MRDRPKLYHRPMWRRGARSDFGSLSIGFCFALGSIFLAACSLGPFVTANTADYNKTIEDVTNSVLVTNILRARDLAPLYFSDLAQIRGSLQVSVQPFQTTIPFAHFTNSQTPSSVQSGPLTVASQPGFDIAPLNTKNFAEGMLTGINANVFSYFIQRHVPVDLFLHLVVSRIDTFRRTGTKKSGDPQYSLFKSCPEGCPNLIKLWTGSHNKPMIGLLPKDNDIGPPIPAEILARQPDTLRNLVQVNDAELDLNPTKSNRYQLSKTEQKFVLCVDTLPVSRNAVGIASFGVNKDPEEPPVADNNGSCRGGRPDPNRYVIYTRSVEAIFFYLGDLVKYPEKSLIGFHIYDHPVAGARFHTYYNGVDYFVCEASDTDQTITILALLNAFLNLNRDADEIPTTRTVATGP